LRQPIAFGSSALGKRCAFLVRPGASSKTLPDLADVVLPAQFSHSQSQAAVSAARRKNAVYRGKEIIMEYLVVFATMLMIAAYAFIIGRTLRNSEHH
jgi:hypothetical protein